MFLQAKSFLSKLAFSCVFLKFPLLYSFKNSKAILHGILHKLYFKLLNFNTEDLCLVDEGGWRAKAGTKALVQK